LHRTTALPVPALPLPAGTNASLLPPAARPRPTGRGRPPVDRLLPYHWPTVYCLDICYLSVARAASAASAHFSALIYIEHWCEAAHRRAALPRASALCEAADRAAAGARRAGGKGSGGRSGAGAPPLPAPAPGPSLLERLLPGATQAGGVAGRAAPRAASAPTPGARGGGRAPTPAAEPTEATMQAGPSEEAALSEVESLLLGLYEQVNDPDGVYAIAALFDSARSRLALLRREARWADVLAAADEWLQHPAAFGGAQGAAACGATGGGGGGEKLELLRALERMGCRHTAQQYLEAAAAGAEAGLPVGAGIGASAGRGGGTSLAEVQAQLAWQLGQWGPAACAPASGKAGQAGAVAGGAGAASWNGGFQSAVLRSLQLLCAGDGEAFGAVLVAARHAEVGALVANGDDSAVTINRSLVSRGAGPGLVGSSRRPGGSLACA
jgi:hypothetical protein